MVLLFGGICFYLLLKGAKRYRKTTLFAPMLWALFSVLSVTVVFGILWPTGYSSDNALVHYMAATTTFCPIMAVLGAKRPQNRGWFWVVLVLLFTTWIPVAQWFAVRPSGPFELFILFKLMLIVLLGLQLLNYAPTKFFIPVVLVSFGQWLLFEGLLPLPYVKNLYIFPTTAFASFAVAAAWITIFGNASKAPSQHSIDSFNANWLTFRNLFGAFWGIRVQQRIIETGRLQNWPVELTWNGFLPREGDIAEIEIDAKLVAQIEQAMQTMLRRFMEVQQAE